MPINYFIKKILYTAGTSLILLMGLVYFTPIPFTAISPDSYWCESAYALTNSGGTIGFFVVLFFTSLCYASSAASKTLKTQVFFKSFFSLLVFFGSLALLNERYTKPLLKLQRPSHVYMLNQTGSLNVIDSLYQLDKKNREAFFENLVKTHPLEFKQIDEDITEHWIEEAGFSFPSGHTFNSFLFAMILSYAIIYNRSYPRLRKWFFIPFIWALFIGISRVAIGAHSALDVSAGAALGIFIGWFFLYIEKTRHWLTRKTKL